MCNMKTILFFFIYVFIGIQEFIFFTNPLDMYGFVKVLNPNFNIDFPFHNSLTKDDQVSKFVQKMLRSYSIDVI